ncbi:hypothetical protein BKA65DRAFT_174630 [Rhexocercosporidium sp. MPI-PUGE-AT-0058]|nr:hypothetical protein BKA65DRAFT_174630 [Rhexocercosporidium sp. MPI-PUGE-AT-0058]
MDNSKNIIADAFNKLTATITEEHAHDFASTTLEAVWKAVRDIDSSQRQRQSAQNLGRIKPLLQGIEKYSKVIEVLCNGTPYLPYVWAPIKLMVQFASQHCEVFESLLAAYADIGAVLPRFDRFEKAFSDIPSFRVALANMYKIILDFHRKAYKLLSRRAWHVLFLSLWTDYKTRFSSIIDGLKTQRDFLDTEAMSIHMSQSKDAREKLQTEIQENQRNAVVILEQLESKAKISRLQHAVAWLSVDDKTQEYNFETISNRRHDKTCQWIAKNDQLLSWKKDDEKHSLLWLNGKPGAGKSVMCSYILQLLEKPSSQHHVSYYFCNSQESGNICSQILRTIALQLLRRKVDLASLIANQYVYLGTSCGMAQLRTLLPQMLETLESTRIIIDGLDECPELETQVSILRELQRLLGKDLHCKVIISSRREVKIAEKLSRKPQIQLDGRQEVESDIRLYVKYKIGSIETADHELRAKIESILVEKANGMFLWVRLVVDELRACGSDWELEEKAESLPRGLKKAYGRILDRIMDETHSDYPRSLAIKILEWLACSYRPLKIFELLDGIVFKVGCTQLNSRTKMRKAVLDSCRPLIEDGPSGTIDFVHFSAKEYVLDEEYRQSTTFISREKANLNICFSCVAYLNTSFGLLPHISTSQSRYTLVLSGFHGLQLYANSFFAKHLVAYLNSLAGSRSRAAPELVAELQSLRQFSKHTDVEGTLSNSAAFNLDALNESPQLMSFMLQLITFRESVKQKEGSSEMVKSPEEISLESCSLDPTYFSEARNVYQESIFGPAAYVCRYLHCSKATDGFDSLKKRETHEAAHQRKFRCTDTSCASFAMGFTTKNALCRHNEKWHRIATEFTRLLVLLLGNPSTKGISLADREHREQSRMMQHYQASSPGSSSSHSDSVIEEVAGFESRPLSPRMESELGEQAYPQYSPNGTKLDQQRKSPVLEKSLPERADSRDAPNAVHCKDQVAEELVLIGASWKSSGRIHCQHRQCSETFCSPKDFLSHFSAVHFNLTTANTVCICICGDCNEQTNDVLGLCSRCKSHGNMELRFYGLFGLKVISGQPLPVPATSSVV